MTALHPERGRIDATAQDLGCGWTWSAVHRVQPRSPLTCPECGHGLQAKVSHRGLKFFAHDPGAPTCALAGESMEHRLLKLELVLAARDAGWHAELEVPASSGRWRADVLVTSPDGSQRTAWEAQLSSITPDHIRQRTERFAVDGVAVCWATTRRPPWLGEVPSIRVRPPADDPGAQWQVVEGLARFIVEPCEHKRTCPGGGHGTWSYAQPSLRDFVAWALSRRIALHRPLGEADLEGTPWRQIWTAPRYAATAVAFARAVEQDRRRSAVHGTVRVSYPHGRDAEHFARKVARVLTGADPSAPRLPALRAPGAAGFQTAARARQELGAEASPSQVRAAVTAWVRDATGSVPELRASSRLADGTPVYLNGQPYGILQPDPEQLDCRQWPGLKHLVIFTTSRDELRRIASEAPDGVRVVVLMQPHDA